MFWIVFWNAFHVSNLVWPSAYLGWQLIGAIVVQPKSYIYYAHTNQNCSTITTKILCNYYYAHTNQQLSDCQMQILLRLHPSPINNEQMAEKIVSLFAKNLQNYISQNPIPNFGRTSSLKNITEPSCCLPVCKIHNFQFWRRKKIENANSAEAPCS